MILFYLGTTISVACSIYTLALFARVILDWARFFAPQWRPSGLVLVLANALYAVTDPPLRWLRRFIPPLRLGAVALDVGFLVLFLAVTVLGNLGVVIAGFGR